jgi:hypothetical protein
MFIRRETKTLSGNRTQTYLVIAHSVREKVKDGSSRTKPVVFARLGREDELDEAAVRGMVGALERYYRKRFGTSDADPAAVAEVAQDVRAREPQLRILASRAYGMRVIVEHVWKQLGLHKALRAVARKHAVTFSFERVVFAMVLNRLVDPTSKRACNEWIANEAWFPEADGLDVQHFYRALDLLDLHEAEVLDAIGRGARERLAPEDLQTLLIDTTTTYVESDFDDEERRQIAEEWDAFWHGEGPKPLVPPPRGVNEPPLRMRGHSKDKRPKEPQIKIGLVSTPNAEVVDIQTWAGNTHDQVMTMGLLKAARRRIPEGRLVAVMDSGMGGTPNLMAIDALEPAVDRVTAVPLRNSRFAEEKLLSRPGRWAQHPFKEGFTVRSVLVAAEDSPTGRAELWVATRNEAEAGRQGRLLEKEIARIKLALAEDCRTDGHGRPMCKLLASPKRRRFLKLNSKKTRYVLDHDRIRIEARRAGVHVLRSTLVDAPVDLTLKCYEAQYGVEAQFRALKSPLKLRPMHHRKDRRIRGHVLMCGLALAVMRELERQTGQTLQSLQRIMGRTRAMQVQQGKTVFWQREEWSEEACAVLQSLGAEQGPRTWGARRQGA